MMAIAHEALLFKAESRTCYAAAARNAWQESGRNSVPVHCEAIHNDRSGVTAHGQTAVNSNYEAENLSFRCLTSL